MYPGCDCEDVCSVGCLCLLSNGPVCNSDGCLISTGEDGGPLLECNSNCSCNSNCPNRCVQSGRGCKNHLQVFQTARKGVGVVTKQAIAQHRYVCDYSGEIIRKSEATRRAKIYGRDETNYIFTLREHVASRGIICTYVDATASDCISKFINHSCDPNLMMLPVRVDSILPTLALFAVRNIEADEELVFDYSGGEQEDEANYEGCDRIVCYCDSQNCRGYLPYNKTLF